MTDCQIHGRERHEKRMLDAIFHDCSILLGVKEKIIALLDRLPTLGINERREMLHSIYVACPEVYDVLTYDLVICSEVIEHIDNYQDVLKGISYVLKPNGYLFLSSPDAPIYKDPAHVHNLVRFGALRNALDETCLDVVRTSSMPFSKGATWYFACQKR